MKHKFAKLITSFSLLTLLGIGVSTIKTTSNQLVVQTCAIEENETGTILFGSGIDRIQINSASVSVEDNIKNTWTITTLGTTSFTQNAEYSQIGSSKSAASLITFTMTLPNESKITAMSAEFGGFSGTAGSITLKVGDKTVGTGELNGDKFVTVESAEEVKNGKTLTISVTGISKGVKCCNLSYTIEEIHEDPIQTFIDNYMHMDKDDPGQCVDFYPQARDAFGKLSKTEQVSFLNKEQYKPAADRFRAWARAHGQMYSKKDGTFINDPTVYNNIVENNITIIAVTSSVALVTIVTVLVIAIRKRKKA